MSRTRSLAGDLNPTIKLIMLILVTVLGTFEYKPFLPMVLIGVGCVITVVFTNLSLKVLWKGLRLFVVSAFSFVVIILLVRKLSGEDLQLINVSALGVRIVMIALYANLFVKTTDPELLIVSLMQQWRVPPKYGYGFMAAYRFLPTFQEEVDVIRYAFQVRGVGEGNNIFAKVWNSKRFIIPLMTTAIRKGSRIAISMEARGFGKFDTRTNWKSTAITGKDRSSLILFILFLSTLVAVMVLLGLTQFELVYQN